MKISKSPVLGARSPKEFPGLTSHGSCYWMDCKTPRLRGLQLTMCLRSVCFSLIMASPPKIYENPPFIHRTPLKPHRCPFLLSSYPWHSHLRISASRSCTQVSAVHPPWSTRAKDGAKRRAAKLTQKHLTITPSIEYNYHHPTS